MKRFYFIFSLLITFSLGQVWGADATCTLSNDNIVAAGDATTSYASYSPTDGCNQTWNVYAIKNKHSNATSGYHFLQIKKYASSTAYYLQVPSKSGYTIKSISMVVSSSNQPSTGGGNTATLYFSSSKSTSATGNGIASGTGASSVTIDCSSLGLTTGYITASAAVRIWGDISVTYTPDGSTEPTLSSVQVSGTATKKNYEDGDVFDVAGLTVTGTYSNNTQSTISEGITWKVRTSATSNDAVALSSYKLTEGQTSLQIQATVSEKASEWLTVSGLTVTEHVVTPGKYDITFCNAFFGTTGLNGSLSGTNLKTYSGSQNDITIEYQKGSGSNMYLKDSEIRMYNGNALVVAVPTGYNITKIAGLKTTMSAEVGEINTSSEWIGKANSVTLHHGSTTGNSVLKTISVTYAADAKYAVTITNPAHGTITVMNGENAVANGDELGDGTTLNVSGVSTEQAYKFGTISAYKTGDQSTTVTITDGALTMPAYPITITATETALYNVAVAVNNSSMGSATINGGTSAIYVDEDDDITLVATPKSGYEFVNWTVSDDNIILDDENATSTTALAGASGTITANFQQQACTNLAAPTLNGEIAKTYNSATIAWNAVANAESYVLNIKKHEGNVAVVTDEVITAPTVSFEKTGLTANTQYDYSIMAVGNGSTYCSESNPLLEGNFTTSDYPSVTVTYSENGNTDNTATKKIQTAFALPPTAAECNKTFVGWDLNPNCTSAPAYAPGADFTIASNADVTIYAVYATASAGQDVEVLNEDFAAITTGNSTASSGSGSAWTPNSNFSSTTNAVYQAGGAIRLGKSGSLTTKSIDLSSGVVVVSFKLKGWSASENTISVQVDDQTAQNATCTGYMSTGDFESKSLTFAAGTATSVVKFTTSSSVRVFVDDIVISVPGAASYSDYSTTCEAALDKPTFTPAANTYTEAQNITISATEGTVYYTLDGTTPDANSTKYTGAIALNACGETTIKAIAISSNSQSDVVTATYTLNLPIPENSEDDPYTAAEAIEVYDGGCYNNENVYVTGTVQTAQFYSNSNTYTITLTNGFQFYKFYEGANNKTFLNDYIKTGDVLVAYGKLSKYNTTYQLAEGCYLVSREEYTEPLVDISNTKTTAYTVAEALELAANVSSDLTKAVYVKGVVYKANSFNSTNGTYNIYIKDKNADNQFEFYKCAGLYNETQGQTVKFAEGDVAEGDEVIGYGVMTYFASSQIWEFTEGNYLVELVRPEVAVTSVQLDKNTLSIPAGETATITASVLPANASDQRITWSVVSGNDKASVADGVVTGIALGEAVIRATSVADNTKYADCSVTITATDTRKIAKDDDGFDAISGELNGDISFEALKGKASTSPIVTGDAKFIRIYQNGGYLAVKAVKGCTIDEVIITIPSGCNNTTIAVGTNESDLPTTGGTAVTKGTSFTTGTGMNSQNVYLVCLGTTSSTRLEVGTIVVKYTGEQAAVDHLILSGEYETEFTQGDSFDYTGLVVTAAYDANGTDTQDVTELATITAPDMNTAGEKTVTVAFGGKETSYTINVAVNEELDDISGTWKLVTGADQLEAGKKVIVAQAVSADGVVKTMGLQNSNNRAAVSSTVADETLSPDIATKVFTLVDAGSGKYALETSKGKYLSAAGSGSNNYLREAANYDASNAKWTITISNNKATVQAASDNHNTLRYNSGNTIFSCYEAGSQEDIALYVLTPAQEPEPQEPVYNFEDVRTGLTVGKHYTITLPKKVVAVEGGIFWSLRNRNSANTTVYLVEEFTPFEAGTPYVFYATSTTLKLAYEGNATNVAGSAYALRGTFSAMDQTAIDAAATSTGSPIFIMHNNMLRQVSGRQGNSIAAGRAYIVYNSLTTTDTPTSVPGRRVKAITVSETVATGIDETSDESIELKKVIIDGQFYILRDGKTYDVTGNLVK